MRSITLAAILVITIMVIGIMPNQTLMQQAHAQAPVKREVSIPVKVVFVGFDPATVDTSYIKWNFNLPLTTYSEVLSPQPNLTGIIYKIDYSFSFADDAFKSKLVSYLQSIQVTKSGPNPWFYYYVGEPSGYVTSTNYYTINYTSYDANKVEDWVYSNQQELGGFPSNGWTLMLMNLPELPSYDFQRYKDFLKNNRDNPPSGTAHYYSVQYRDSDLGYQLRFRDFMTGWGGVHRFWFDDVSAGPTFWSSWEDLPLQIVLKDNRIDLQTPYGKTWFTQYVADYIWQATWNFVTPFFVYLPMYSEKYTFHVHVFDNRTSAEKREVDLRSTIDSDKIKQAFQDLLPYSKIDVQVDFGDLSKYPELEDVIYKSYKYTDSFTFGSVFAQPLRYGIVDARPVYKYLQDNFRTLEPNFRRDRSQFTVPVFSFAFSKETLFTFTYKWLIQKADSEVKALLGVALGDLALISLSQRQFQRGDYVTPIQPSKGEGFTEVVIHESGHMIGLPHPHQFGDLGDFTLSAMGYYTYDYVFGQSDKDAIRRAHVDQIYLDVQSMLQRLSQSNADASSVDQIRNQLLDVDAKYSQMDYLGAMSSVLKADNLAESVLGGAAILPGGVTVQRGLAGVVYIILGVALGLVVGFAVAWLVLRRKAVTLQNTD